PWQVYPASGQVVCRWTDSADRAGQQAESFKSLISTPSLDDCKLECDNDPTCVAVTFREGAAVTICYLFSHIPVVTDLVQTTYSVKSCHTGSALDCDFDTDFCGWTQSKADNMDWSRGTGRTVSGGTDPEPNTGPDNDHTSGAGYYIYLEASEGVQGDNAILTSPPVDWTGADGSPKGCLTFWYNMNGWNTGSLELQLPNPGIEGTPATVLWSETGQQNNVWREARFVLVATKGLDWAGDIAVDDISLTHGDCSG
ncbi:hypothetical protein BaRGS_00039402, partial [Batillaria attramentaria]